MVLLGYPRPSLAGIGVPWVLTGSHRCALMPRVASRQSANPFCGWCCLEVMCLGRGRRDVLSCTFCQMLELRTLTPLLDWKRCSQALSRHHSYHPGLRGSRFLASDCVLNPSKHFRVEICSVVLLEVRVAPLHCTSPVQPGRCSSRASSSR